MGDGYGPALTDRDRRAMGEYSRRALPRRLRRLVRVMLHGEPKDRLAECAASGKNEHVGTSARPTL